MGAAAQRAGPRRATPCCSRGGGCVSGRGLQGGGQAPQAVYPRSSDIPHPLLAQTFFTCPCSPPAGLSTSGGPGPRQAVLCSCSGRVTVFCPHVPPLSRLPAQSPGTSAHHKRGSLHPPPVRAVQGQRRQPARHNVRHTRGEGARRHQPAAGGFPLGAEPPPLLVRCLCVLLYVCMVGRSSLPTRREGRQARRISDVRRAWNSQWQAPARTCHTPSPLLAPVAAAGTGGAGGTTSGWLRLTRPRATCPRPSAAASSSASGGARTSTTPPTRGEPTQRFCSCLQLMSSLFAATAPWCQTWRAACCCGRRSQAGRRGGRRRPEIVGMPGGLAAQPSGCCCRALDRSLCHLYNRVPCGGLAWWCRYWEDEYSVEFQHPHVSGRVGGWAWPSGVGGRFGVGAGQRSVVRAPPREHALARLPCPCPRLRLPALTPRTACPAVGAQGLPLEDCGACLLRPCQGGWVVGWVAGRVGGWVGGWMGGWMGGWVGGSAAAAGWVDGWVGGSPAAAAAAAAAGDRPREACLPSHPCQDLVLPSLKVPDHFRFSPLVGAPTRKRVYLAFHRGRVRGEGRGKRGSRVTQGAKPLLQGPAGETASRETTCNGQPSVLPQATPRCPLIPRRLPRCVATTGATGQPPLLSRHSSAVGNCGREGAVAGEAQHSSGGVSGE